jgi:hypothetical protein
MQRLFVIAWTSVVVVAIGLMVLLYVSLIPHFGEIGDAMIWVIRIGLACGTTLMLVATWSLAGSLLAKRRRDKSHERVIVAGEVVAYLAPDGTFVHLSAQHEAAKVPPVKVPELPSPDPRWDAVLDLRRDGKGMHQIAKDLKVPYNRVRTFLNQVERNESET